MAKPTLDSGGHEHGYVLRQDATALAAELRRVRAELERVRPERDRFRLALACISSWHCESPRLVALDVLGQLENH